MHLGREIQPAAAIGRPGFREYPGPLGFAILSLLFAALAVFGYAKFPRERWFFTSMAAVAALLLGCALLTCARWLRFGVTLSLRERGLVLNGVEIPYAEIASLTVRDRRRFDETATIRVLTRTIAIETGAGMVKAVYVTPAFAALEELLNDLAGCIAAQERPREGKGWRVEQRTLFAGDERVALSAITAAGVFEREVRLWRHHEEEHFFAVPYETKNARVLLALAETARQALPSAAQRPPASADGPGRLLFARRTSLSSVLGNTLMTAFVLSLVWVGLVRYLHVPDGLAFQLVLGAFVVWLGYSVYRKSVGYRFHERAVVRTSLLGSRTLAYADVASMQWSTTAMSVEHAIPMGTTVKAKLVPQDASPPLSIVLHRFRGDDADLASVRDAIAAPIAHAMRRRLDRGEDVAWTRHAKFTRAGLFVKDHLVAPPMNVHLHDGMLMFFHTGKRAPFAMLSAGDENFHPGLMLLHEGTSLATSSSPED